MVVRQLGRGILRHLVVGDWIVIAGVLVARSQRLEHDLVRVLLGSLDFVGSILDLKETFPLMAI